MTASKIVAAAASSAGGDPLDVDDLFSTDLYVGNGSTQTITNGIDLSGEGGLVWQKLRTASKNHNLFDTVSGANKYLSANQTTEQLTDANINWAFNGNGWSMNNNYSTLNTSGDKGVAWTFRKAKKFFDVVTWTGDGTSGRNISHNLGSVPGHIIVKKRSGGSVAGWINWHRTFSDYQSVFLNTTEALYNPGNIASGVFGQASNMTSTQFQLGGTTNITYHNENNSTYVAYLFAHNNNDGGFGPDGDADIIKCGTYTGNNSTTGPVIDLGFEPQWIFIKHIDSGAGGGDSSFIFDSMRGVVTGGGDPSLSPNAGNDEQNASNDMLDFNASGFQLKRANSDVNGNNNNYIYVAIRRGPLAVPEDATKVFAMTSHAGGYSSGRIATTNFPVDFTIGIQTDVSSDRYTYDRLRGGKNHLRTNQSNSEGTNSPAPVSFDYINSGIKTQLYNSSNNVLWSMWKRAPSYFDVCCYNGNGSTSQNVSHNLDVRPEMMWVKCRSDSDDWIVYHSGTGEGKYLRLNATGAAANWTGAWNDTTPSQSVFTVGNGNAVNVSGRTYVAYLFATAEGVSKVGSYTGNGSGGGATQTIDCGFSSGARFVLIKRTSTGSWFIFNTVRGIVSSTEPHLTLETTDAEVSGNDSIDPHSSGFTVVQNGTTEINSTGQTYIFYAIA